MSCCVITCATAVTVTEKHNRQTTNPWLSNARLKKVADLPLASQPHTDEHSARFIAASYKAPLAQVKPRLTHSSGKVLLAYDPLLPRGDRQRIETWFQNFLRIDMRLEENILSEDEYAKALKGKRHFKHESL
jgi:hypothetical protein